MAMTRRKVPFAWSKPVEMTAFIGLDSQCEFGKNPFSTEQSENVYENKGTAQKGVSISGLRKTNWFLSFQSAMVPVLISAIFRLRSATP